MILDAFRRLPKEMTRARLTPEQRRERNRLRSLCWRRAHGIGPRKPAQSPWLALGISRRRRAKARSQAALAAREAVLDRLAWQIAELRAGLDRCAVAHAAMAVELAASPGVIS
jgi:hypothetical protein